MAREVWILGGQYDLDNEEDVVALMNQVDHWKEQGYANNLAQAWYALLTVVLQNK